jgi:hypothetical protein
MNNQTPLGMIIDPWISMQKRPVVHMDEGKREGGSVLVDSNPSKEELAETPTTYKLGFYVTRTRLTQLSAASISQLRRCGTQSS